MTVDIQSNYDRRYITNYSETYREPEWLLDLRLRGLELSEHLSLPKVEKTNIRSWGLLPAVHAAQEEIKELSPASELSAEVKHFLGDEQEAENLVVHKNGQPVYHQLSKDLQEKGVIFTDWATAVQKHGHLLADYAGRLVNVDEHKLTALHTALINGGVFLYVPKNVQVELPLQSLFWQEQAQSGLFPHIVLVAEANSQVTYVENTFGSGQSATIHNYVAEVFVGENARVTFAAIDHLDEKTTSYIYRRAKVGAHGHVEWALGQMNSGNIMSDNTTVLEGDGSTANTKSVVVGKGEQSQNFVQKMQQIGLHTDGQILSHAVMKDRARAIFNGISKIEKGSTKSNGEQTERVLMLSEKARGDANPILLIDEDDVTAGHAASVGQVDKMELYYLMSRGIPREEAERLIIMGFLSPVVDQIPLDGMKKRLIEIIERKIIS